LSCSEIAELNEGESLGLNLEQSQVRPRVGADDLRLVIFALEGRHLHIHGVLDDVIIGQKIAVLAEEETGPLGLGGDFLFPLAGTPKEPLPEIVERHLVLEPESSDLVHPLGHDLDDCGTDLLGDADEVEVTPLFRGSVDRGGVEGRGQGRFLRIKYRSPGGVFVGEIDEHVSRDDDSQEETDYSDPDDFFHFSLPPEMKV
jgi:hypothetical protein